MGPFMIVRVSILMIKMLGTPLKNVNGRLEGMETM